MLSSSHPGVIFYDSDCMMCSGFVLFVLKYDTQDRFLFSPLSQIEKLEGVQADGTTIVVKAEEQYFFESRAIFLIVKNLRFPVNLLSIFSIIPRFISDRVYRLISKNRKKIPLKNYCRLLDSHEKKKFL